MPSGIYSRIRNEFCKNGHKMSETRKEYISGHSYCSQCKKERTKKAYHRNPTKYRLTSRKLMLNKKYGLTIEDLEKMIEKQNKKCAICFQDLQVGTVKCCIDHNHETGEVRGILCSNCNTGIGLLKENNNILQSAIKYLSNQVQSRKK